MRERKNGCKCECGCKSKCRGVREVRVGEHAKGKKQKRVSNLEDGCG